MSALQLATADGERGRVFAVFGAVFSAGQAVGMLAAGLLGEHVSIAWLLDAQGLLFVLGGVVALLWLSDPRRQRRQHRRSAVADSRGTSADRDLAHVDGDHRQIRPEFRGVGPAGGRDDDAAHVAVAGGTEL
jgi:MFS family permease